MTAAEIQAAIKARPDLVALLPDTAAVAAALSVGRTRYVERLITERRIMDVLGVVAGDAFLSALEGFAAASLAPDNPLRPVQPGFRRALAWLKSPDGIDIGSAQARALLGALATAGIVDAAHAAVVIALAAVPDPVPEFDVRRAVFADNGTLLV